MSDTRILPGNCIDTLKTLDACSVQTCITSPPYFGLRDYGTARWMGGTDPECNHQYQKGGRNPETSAKQISSAGTTFSQYEKVCKRCGALRIDDQIGLEETPEAYVEKLVQVFREVKRVLSMDGTLWLNLGDSYAGSGKGPTGSNGIGDQEMRQGFTGSRGVKMGSVHGDSGHTSGVKPPPGLKAKDLIGIPWMVAFALRADGWYLRSDIIWHKPNPMPESVTDRPTKSHEYIFLLSKSAQYYYDADAIAEQAAGGREKFGGDKFGAKGLDNSRNDGGRHDDTIVESRNKRSVWTVTTKPYSGAHFATFPPDLIEPCILAGSRPGDWVLDPFNGSGTTGAVALKHHRNYIGCELNPEYIELTNKRFANVQPVLFAAVQP